MENLFSTLESLPSFEQEMLKVYKPTIGTGTSEPVMGLTAIETGKLTEKSELIYPSKGFYYDVDTINFELFGLLETDNGTLIQVKNDGLYQVDFCTSLLPYKKSLIEILLVKTPNNKIISRNYYHLDAFQYTATHISKFIRLNQRDMVYVLCRLLNVDGEISVWVGDKNFAKAKEWSSLYIRKI